MSKTPKRREKSKVSSKDYAYLDKQITSWGGTFAYMQEKRKAIKETIEKKIPEEQQKNIENFKKTLFLNFKEGLDNSIVANTYLFELIKDEIAGDKRYGWLYKINVIKKDNEQIICEIKGINNYKRILAINNNKIMEKKQKKDTLEEGFTITKTYYQDWIKKEKTRPGRKEDFLMEIDRGDSVIINVEWSTIKKIHPDNIIDEIKEYTKMKDNNPMKNKKIRTAMTFFNESQERMSSAYIKEFFTLVREKHTKRNTNKEARASYEEHKEHFAEVLKKFLNKEKLYLHRGEDIDKGAVQFLLKKLGIKDDKIFHEIDHADVDSIDEGVFFDVGGTVSWIKTVGKIVGKNKKGKEIKKTKTIVSEHIDDSDAALLSNRPPSTTQIIFKIFKELWTIKKEDLAQMERFVNFVNTIDSMEYQVSAIDYQNNYQTLFGLYRYIPMEYIFEYFKNPEKNGFEKLSYKEMEKIISKKTDYKTGKKKTLREVSIEQKKIIDDDIKNFKTIQQKGREFTYKWTKFLLDIEEKGENKIKNCAQTTGHHEYGYFTIKEGRGNIYMYSPKKLPGMIEWYKTDGNFLFIDKPTPEIIKKLFEKFIYKGSLEEETINHLKKIHNKTDRKNITKKDINERTEKLLKPLSESELKTGKTYTGIINNVQNKFIYVNLDNEMKIKWIIKVEDKQEAKKFQKWNFINVRIEEINKKESGEIFLKLSVKN